MKRFVPVLFAANTVLLSACGGGGASGSRIGPPPTVAPTQTPGAIGAEGTLVDDAGGTPLAGQRVQLDPWIAYPTPGPTPTPILTTTTDADGHFTVKAPNGTYLLVIGPDTVNTPPPGWATPAPSATDTPIPGVSGWYATVHDRLVLSGQTVLVAPTMPPEPYYTPPATETRGAYRLSALDPLTEAPCILAYNQQRIALGLPAAVADEWSVENTRAVVNASYLALGKWWNGHRQFSDWRHRPRICTAVRAIVLMGSTRRLTCLAVYHKR